MLFSYPGIIESDGREHAFELGAHAPALRKEDIALIHKLWVQVSRTRSRWRIHHRDVVLVALNRLERDLKGRSDAMLDFYKLEHEDGRTETPQQPDAAPAVPDNAHDLFKLSEKQDNIVLGISLAPSAGIV